MSATIVSTDSPADLARTLRQGISAATQLADHFADASLEAASDEARHGLEDRALAYRLDADHLRDELTALDASVTAAARTHGYTGR